MHLVVGLGNPGREHEGQRHNVGFMVTGELRASWGLPEPRLNAKWKALSTRGETPVGGVPRPVALLQPQTYMNLSGDAVQPAAAFYGVDVASIIVVHDELDLPFGDVRIKVGGGHAGHNGLRSLIARLGAADFVRVRVGIGRPPARDPAGADGGKPGHGDVKAGVSVSAWVLGRFDVVERALLPPVLERAGDAVTRVLRDGAAAAQLALHAPSVLPRPSPPPAGRGETRR